MKEILKETRTPIIKLIYRRTGVECDISVQNGLSVENSKLLRYCILFYLYLYILEINFHNRKAC